MVQLMVIEGEPGSSDIRLEVTPEGEAEIEQRLDKLTDQIAELSMKGLENTLRFYKGDLRGISSLMAVLAKSRAMSEIWRIVSARVKEEQEQLAKMVAEANGSTLDIFGLTDDDVKAGARREGKEGERVVWPDGREVDYFTYVKLREKYALYDEQARIDREVVGFKDGDLGSE